MSHPSLPTEHAFYQHCRADENGLCPGTDPTPESSSVSLKACVRSLRD